MRLPRPPRFEKVRGLSEHFLRIQQEIEQEDRKNLKRDDVAGRTSRTVVTYTSGQTIGQGQDVVLCDTDSGGFTLTLMPAAERFKVLSIKNIGTSGNDLTIDANASETIDGGATLVLSDLDAARLQSDGAGWWIL